MNKKNLALAAGAVVGAALSSFNASAKEAVIYDHDGIVLKLDHGTKGEMKLTVTNNTKETIHDVTLNNDEIKGLTLSDKRINLGTVRAGETRDVEFKYSLEKATVELVNKSIEEKIKQNETKNTDSKEESTLVLVEEETNQVEDKKSTNKATHKAVKKGVVQTGDDSHSENKLMKIVIPVVIAGVAGVLVIFAIKKNKKSNKNTLALLIGLGAFGTAIFGFNPNNEVNATERNINEFSGRIMHNIPIQGITSIEGVEYEYAGTFYYEEDDIQTKREERSIPVGVDIEEDSTMAAGTFKVIYDDVREGMQKYIITYVNGREVSKEADSDEIPARNYKVIVGTKPTTTTSSIAFGTLYEADKTQNIGYKEVSKKGENGRSITTTKLADNLDEFKENILDGKLGKEGKTDLLTKEEETKEPPVFEIVKVGTKSVEKRVLEKKTIYSANNNALKGSEPKVLQEGSDGEKEVEVAQDVNIETGELLPEKEIVSEKITEISVPKLVQVGTKEIVEEVIPYETKINKNDSMWEGEENIIVDGVDGLKDVTYIYEVDPDIGLTENKTKVSETIKKEPVVKVVEHGTKLPKYIEKKETSPVKPGEPVVKGYVNKEDFAKIETIEDYKKILEDFNAFITGKTQLADGSCLTVEAKDGETGKVYKVAVDPETNEEITTIERTVLSEINTPAINQESVVLNVSLGEQKETEAKYRYVGDKNLALGQKSTITEAIPGQEQAIVLGDDGSTLWVPAEENPAIIGEISVGNTETIRETLEAGYDIINNDFAFIGNDIIPEGEEGQDGIQDTVYEYEVDPVTGELGEKKAISSTIIKEAVKGEKWVGTLKETGYKASDATIQAALNRLNEERRTRGINELTLDTSNQSIADEQAHVIAARLEQGFKSGHAPGGFNSALDYVTAKYNTGKNMVTLTDEEVGIKAIEDFLNSNTSHKDIILDPNMNTVVISAYYTSGGEVCAVTVSPMY